MNLAASASPIGLLRDDAAIRLQRRMGLARVGGLGVARRALFWGLFAWLPIAVWAAATGHAYGEGGESMLAHYGVTLRLLVAIPLMIVAEAVLLRTVATLARRFVDSGLCSGDPGALREAAASLSRVRDAVHPWVLALGAALAWIAALGAGSAGDEFAHGLAWADEGRGFGALWYLWVGHPIFVACVCVWLWRAILLAFALHRAVSVGMTLVPSHPDRLGGLGFLADLTAAFGIVAFALSAVIAGGWAHDVAHHGKDVMSLKLPMIASVVLLTALFLAPLLVLAGPMGRARKRALLQYGALLSRHGSALHRRWILGETVVEPVLEAPEIGASADAAQLYDAVGKMLSVPLRPAMIAAVAVPAALPMLALLSIQVPIGDLLKAIVGVLL